MTPRERRQVFGVDMVRALESGRKSLMILPVRRQPVSGAVLVKEDNGRARWSDGTADVFARPVDRLLVCEPHEAFEVGYVQYRADFAPDEPGTPKEYRASWRPSSRMPRWAVRYVLPVTSCHAVHVQSVSEEDAKSNGVEPTCASPTCCTHIRALCEWWERRYSIVGKLAWDFNPWVWVVRFGPLEDVS